MVKLVAESSATGIANQESNMTRIYGIGEIAQISGVSISSLTRWRYLKLIKPTIKLGGRYFFDDSIFCIIKRLYYGGRKTPEKPEIV